MPISPSLPLKKLVVLEDGFVIQLAGNPRFSNEFPFLKAIAGMRDGLDCGGCRGQGANPQYLALQNAKMTLAGMGSAQQKKLKDLLQAKQIRLVYKSGNRIIQRTF